jgi:hypothetical protein
MKTAHPPTALWGTACSPRSSLSPESQENEEPIFLCPIRRAEIRGLAIQGA